MKGTIKKYEHFKYVMKSHPGDVLRGIVLHIMTVEDFLKKCPSYTINTKELYGIMAMKRIMRNAVTRNRAKRKIRVVMQNIERNGLVLVVIARSLCLEASVKAMIRNVEKSIEKFRKQKNEDFQFQDNEELLKSNDLD